jgi:ribosomal protein S18 acetylase RimI-like enzyme
MGGSGIELRRLRDDELARVGEIDRTERIDALYVQRGTHLERVEGRFDASRWAAEGHGEHSVAHQHDELRRLAARGASALGAFDGDRLVGIGVVLPHLRPRVAQLAFLHVGAGFRDRGVGGRLVDELERTARDAGDERIVVSATPSEHTVRFYQRHGFRPMAEPVPELLALEPEDVHLEKRL